MKKTLYTTIFVTSLVTPFFAPFFARADNTPVPVNSANKINSGQPESHYSYQFLVPIDILLKTDASGTVQLATQANTENDPFTTYIQNAIKLAIGVAGLMGVIRLIQVGFTVIFESGNVNAVTKVKKELGAIVGSLVLVAGSWVILNTINPLLITQNLLIQPENATTTKKMRTSICEDSNNCDGDTPIGQDGKPMITDPMGNPLPGTYTTHGFTTVGYYYLVIRQKISAEQGAGYEYFQGPFPSVPACYETARAAWDKDSTEHPNFKTRDDISCVFLKQDVVGNKIDETEDKRDESFLKAGNVTRLYPACYQTKGCTNLSGLDASPSGVLQMIVDFKQDCDAWKGSSCNIRLNGGTEPGHSTHGLQYPDTIDAAQNADSKGYLWANSPAVAQSFGGYIRMVYDDKHMNKRWWWTDEKANSANSGDHYHIEPNGGGVYADRWYSNMKYTNQKDAVISDDFSNCGVAGKSVPQNPTMHDCRYIIDGPNMTPRYIPAVVKKK